MESLSLRSCHNGNFKKNMYYYKDKNIYIKNKVLIILIRNLLEAHYLFGKIKLNK